jgi:hypothetical protein
MYRYLLDDENNIVWVDDWWLAFANENGAPELNETSVVGHQIWEFIAGEPTRQLYEELHERVRNSGTPITVPFRCDSPTLQRHMQVTIHSDGNRRLLYESRLLRAEPQRRVKILDMHERRSSESLTMCSCCKRSLLEPSDWLDLQNISLRLRMFEQQTVPELRYTICPDCESQLKLSNHEQASS